MAEINKMYFQVNAHLRTSSWEHGQKQQNWIYVIMNETQSKWKQNGYTFT